MGIFVTIAIIIFVPVCIVLTLIILLQDSKGEGLSSSAFGASEMQSVLGGHGAATFLSKLTTWVAIGFMVISLFLMRFYGERQDHRIAPEDGTKQVQETEDRGASDEGTENTAEDTKANGTPTEENSQDTQESTNEDNAKGEIAPEVETE